MVWATALVLASLLKPATAEPPVKPTSGYAIVWRGEGSRFIEASEKIHKHTIVVTLNAQNFDLKTKEGIASARSVLDVVTFDRIDHFRSSSAKQITERRQEDRITGKVLTRTLELSIVDVKAEAEKKHRDETEEQQKNKAEQERKEKEQEDQRKKQKESVRAPALQRPLEVRTADDGPLQSVKASASEQQIMIAGNADLKHWPSEAGCRPLSVTLYDRNGQFLSRFITPESFTADKKAFDLAAKAAKAPASKPILLKSSGNTLLYDVDRNILQKATCVALEFCPLP